MERVPSFLTGARVLRQCCYDCLCDLDDYYDRKREDEKI